MKTLIAILIFGLGVYGIAATQPQSLGIVDIATKNMTLAQVLISTSTAKGQNIFCTDCTCNGGVGTPCYSTGTVGLNPFVLSTGTVCK